MLACAMTMSSPPKKPPSTNTTPTPSSSPFDALAKLRDSLPVGPAAPSPAAAKPTPIAKGPARAVVRMERKGRGGKEATVIEKLNLPAKQLEQWCRELKQTLGCGGVVEGDTIVLQGDLRSRMTVVLESRGVAKVTLG
jgi:translation initiation factor 1